MKKPSPKQLTVLDSKQVTPNMQRITLHGEALGEFPPECVGSYIKLLFNSTGTTDLNSVAEGQRPVMRTYTIAQFSSAENTIEVDFVRHVTDDLQCGFAARWAMNVQVGETINIVGPGTISDMSTEADWFLLVADMTALPALAAKIRLLPRDATGYAVIKVIEQADAQPIDAPTNVKVIWLTDQESLVDKVESLPWLDGVASVWTACEFDSMRALRHYFRNDKQVPRENIYLSSYWKQGVTEDGHKVIKQQDAKNSQ